MDDDVVSFRPDARERRIIEETMRRHGFKTQIEAVRWLIAASAPTGTLEPLLSFRIPEGLRDGEVWTAEDIDRALYDADP